MNIENISDARQLKQIAILLQKENDRLHKRLEEQTRELARLKGQDGNKQLELEIAKLQEQMSKLHKMMFAASSEKRRGDDSGDESGKDEKKKQTGHGPRKQPELPLEIKDVYLPKGDTTQCEVCKGELEDWKGQYDESEVITVITRSFKRVKIRLHKKRCKCGSTIASPAPPPKTIKGGRYTAEFAVEVAIQKYLDHLPLERQVKIMKREGLVIDSQTLWDQILALARHYEPIYDALYKHVMKSEVVHADETPWFMLKKGRRKQYYAWGAACHDAVYYRIDPSRSKEAAKKLLGDYTGTVVVDAYSAYQAVSRDGKDGGKARLAFCWAHVRRKFLDAEPNYPDECKEALDLIGELYEVERQVPNPWKAEGKEREEIFASLAKIRYEKSRAILDRIKSWAYDQLSLPQSTFRKALEYMLGHWNGLTVFLQDPKVPLDNNLIERAIRGPVVGRKNHYGSKSVLGTKVAAIYYTMIETAKLQGVDPKQYLLEAAYFSIHMPGTVFMPSDIGSVDI